MHLSFAVSSFVQHFIAFGEFKLELQSGNAQFGSNSMIFKSRVTLKFDVWPWKTIGHLYYATSSSMHHFVAIGEFRLELQSRNAQFGSKSMIFFSRVTLQFDVWTWNTIGHLFNATSSFVHHFVAIGDYKLELQSGNAQFGSNSTIFRAGHLFYATSSFVHHFVAIGKFKLELQSGNAQSRSNSTIFGAVWPWNLTDDLEKQ